MGGPNYAELKPLVILCSTLGAEGYHDALTAKWPLKAWSYDYWCGYELGLRARESATGCRALRHGPVKTPSTPLE